MEILNDQKGDVNGKVILTQSEVKIIKYALDCTKETHLAEPFVNNYDNIFKDLYVKIDYLEKNMRA